jgi:cytochrome c oxidase cbb3-type subunit III
MDIRALSGQAILRRGRARQPVPRLQVLPALLACAAAVSAVAGCRGSSSSNSSSVEAATAAPPGIVYEAHIAAGGKPPEGGALIESQEAASAKAGASLFLAMNCDGCHGGGAVGWIAPSLADGRWRYGGADQEIFSSIYFGRPKGMPAFGGMLGSKGVWSIVSYLKSIQVPGTEATESWE